MEGTLLPPEEPSLSGQPLAARMRPASLDEIAGQQHLLGPGKVLRRLIQSDSITSMIFWGPPGVGKTTIARVIALQTRATFIDFSAVTSGIKEIRQVMLKAEENRVYGIRTIVFVDEIHRFNKAQQDAFLPFVEKGSIVLIGATTENPSFEVNSALLSRLVVHERLAAYDLPKHFVRYLRPAVRAERGVSDSRLKRSECVARIAVREDRDLAKRVVAARDVQLSEASRTCQRAAEKHHEIVFREAVQGEDLATREKRGIHLERRILRRGADQYYRALLDVRQKRVLLGLVEAVNLIDEKDRADSDAPA